MTGGRWRPDDTSCNVWNIKITMTAFFHLSQSQMRNVIIIIIIITYSWNHSRFSNVYPPQVGPMKNSVWLSCHKRTKSEIVLRIFLSSVVKPFWRQLRISISFARLRKFLIGKVSSASHAIIPGVMLWREMTATSGWKVSRSQTHSKYSLSKSLAFSIDTFLPCN